MSPPLRKRQQCRRPPLASAVATPRNDKGTRCQSRTAQRRPPHRGCRRHYSSVFPGRVFHPATQPSVGSLIRAKWEWSYADHHVDWWCRWSIPPGTCIAKSPDGRSGIGTRRCRAAVPRAFLPTRRFLVLARPWWRRRRTSTTTRTATGRQSTRPTDRSNRRDRNSRQTPGRGSWDRRTD